MARVFGGVTDDQSRRRAIWETLSGIPSITVLIPFIFYLEFGINWTARVGSHRILRCLLSSLGVGPVFLPRTEYHPLVLGQR